MIFNEAGVIYSHEFDIENFADYKEYLCVHIPSNKEWIKPIYIISGNLEKLINHWNSSNPNVWRYEVC